ncbi:putative ABC transporter permease protein [Beutenbergia cavernae DSM 12333]|uniref:Putative ABC transporter permease protein n=1 Tax=Beutenbergia cavernae (strain ATCC BAA-8 / DSM 12333 / CCUG 43141 / JCM 11478 / NBRC 16432 / NCIMB 13614 / HKI 0122) TaxID=471853 RepID=C5C3T7_BEUC1|nr:ABC transporter permease [Beutenbergia cavernae]ACQ81996.1 putative ABC transporter permease protein [Beutenbergia cavernae DSM 12333]
MTSATLTRGGLPVRRAFRPAARGAAGTGAMIRLVLRRNRVRLAAWFVVIVGLVAYVGSYYTTVFDSQQALDDFAALSDTPSIRALTGLAAAAATLGGAVWTKIWMTCAVALALGVAFLVTRNGRAEEELGRTELLRSRALGIHAQSFATYLVLAVVCLASGAGVALVSMANGLDPDGAGVVGSVVFGASVAGVGLVAIGVAAVAGQLASTARGANMLASVVIGGFYVLRMMGDLGDGTLTWLSPIGWGEKMEPWSANSWWPFALLVGFAAVLLAVATRLEARRDLASGLLPDRPGPSDAAAQLASPLGLALRLQRGAILAWTLTVVLASLLFGSVVEAMTDLVDDAGGDVDVLIGGSGVEALVSLLVMLVALIVAVFALQSTMTLRADEATGILEPQLAGALSRTRWALERLLVPAVGSAVLLLLGGAAMGAGYGSLVGDSGQTWVLAGAALAYWPAVMLLVGIAVALFGWLPRVAIPVTWSLLGLMWLLVLVGDALNLPDWVLDGMPFSATPYQPLESMDAAPLVVLAALAAAGVALGLARFARRDLRTG